MIWVNGQPDSSIDVHDRGLAYGDGVFRTLRTQLRKPVWWPDHYAKLVSDCAALALVCPPGPLLYSEVCAVAEAAEGVVKIVVTRGAGARGYAPPLAHSPTRIVSSSALPAHALGDASPDIVARWCTLKLAQQPRLAGVKHLNRLENVLARAEWHDAAIFEGLLCDSNGTVIGGVMSNVFWCKDGELFTPGLHQCGVAGVTRSRLLRAAAHLDLRVHIGRWMPDAILAADEVMICNSLIGVRRVAKLDDVTWMPAGWTTTLNNAIYENLD